MANSGSNNSLSSSMDGAQKHYAAMFFLPPYKRAVLTVALICIGIIGLSTYALFPTTQGLTASLTLGVALFAITLVVDAVMSKVILKDPIYILRRTVAMSLFCWIFWGFFLILGVVTGYAFGTGWWFKFTLLGFGAVITLRFIVLLATSSVSIVRQVLSVLLWPYLCVSAFLGFWSNITGAAVTQTLPYLIVAPIIAYLAVYVFLNSLDKVGKQINGLPAMPLFKAFMLNWVVAANAPLETRLEEMGENEDIDVTMLRFDTDKPKAAIIVPLVHPGPFKNIGSSLLPSLLKKNFEETYGCQTCTPLGILGHELDLASQAQNFKVINQIIEAAKYPAEESVATPFVQVSEGYATASCQIFGDTAFLSFTLSPKTTEDLPQELGQAVEQEAKKYGLKCTIVVNCHNSLNDVIDTVEHLAEFETAAFKCIQKAASLPKKPFKVGASTVYPTEFTMKEGMGTGGITAIVVQVEQQKTAYVVVDGNNMISGFREKVLPAIKAAGFEACEVFTTDTHAVSALVTGSRGYHPVGEVMNNEILINHMVNAAKTAASNLEPAKAGCKHLVVPQVRVIGGSRIESLSQLVDKALVKAKRVVVPIFLVEGLVLILLLALL